MQTAKALGCRVIATARKTEKLKSLTEEGADEAILDEGRLGDGIRVTKALELIGAKALKDTLLRVEKGGAVCVTGVLGGKYYLDDFDPIKDIPNGVYLTGFYSNSPNQKTVDEMFHFIEEHKIKPRIGAVFSFDDIQKAVVAQDCGRIDGKTVVVL